MGCLFTFGCTFVMSTDLVLDITVPANVILVSTVLHHTLSVLVSKPPRQEILFEFQHYSATCLIHFYISCCLLTFTH